MPSELEAPAPGLVRAAIPYTRLPWFRPLVDAVTHRYETVAPFFGGNPADPGAWRAAIDRVTRRARDHAALVSVIEAQQARRHAPTAARAAARSLTSPRAVAIVTGQQAGLFGGPLYTLLKAVTTIQLAREAADRHGVPAVPVFWVDADDHDWQEIRTATILDREYAPAGISATDLPGCGVLPVSALTFDDRIDATVTQLADQLAPSEFTATVVAELRRHYRAGSNPAAACAGWLETLLGDEGLVVFEASDPAAKPLVSDVFHRELAHACDTARRAREAGDRLSRAGHHAQIMPADDVVSVFRMDAGGRHAIRCRDGRFVIDDQDVPVASLLEEADRYPDRLSPNVLLRPVVQDTLFPTVCYVAGPSELAYHGQLGDIYEAFDVDRPLVACRASATILDSAAARFFDRTELPLAALQPQDESALNALLATLMPAEVDETFTAVEAFLSASAPKLSSAAAAVDPTLAGAAETTVTKMRETVKNLQAKILQASKKKDETLRRQFVRTRSLAFPDGQPQERHLSVAYFANRYGLGIGRRLLDGLPSRADAHYVIVP